MKNNFIKPEHDPDMNPVEYFNQYRSWEDVFAGFKEIDWTEKCIKGDYFTADVPNKLGFVIGKKYSKFQAYCRSRYAGNYTAAQTSISLKWLNAHVPYIRVGTDYFKVITKTDRYGVERKIIKGWKKEEIKQDHRELLSKVHLYDDFCIVPDNIDYRLVINNCYNLYSPFSHRQLTSPTTTDKIPVSLKLMRHIFGDQLDLGLTYLKVLYLHPDAPLPILCLVSRERQTGKTTFLNWMQMIFGDNFIQINPEDLTSQFNSSYASKNIIALDETVLEKSHAVEKLKSIATAKSISVNQKFVANYALPFFGKVILCTNKEKDFMRIDEEEIRFWVRKVTSIESINTKIEKQLKDEIPAFLRYLYDLPPVDFTKSRMVFTADQIKNDQLISIQRESWSQLRKEIYIHLEDYFNQNDGVKELKATPGDIKKQWFDRNNQVNASYLLKVLKDEMQLKQGELQRYAPFSSDPLSKVRGRPFMFNRSDYVDVNAKIDELDEIPF